MITYDYIAIAQISQRYNLVCVSYTDLTPGLSGHQGHEHSLTVPAQTDALFTTQQYNYFQNALCCFQLLIVTLRNLHRSPANQVLGVHYVKIVVIKKVYDKNN